MDNAEHGVVLFSMGYTWFRADVVPPGIIEALVTAFSNLKQRVIMRFDSSQLPFIPDNVMVVDWVPQREVLGKQIRNIWIQNIRCISFFKLIQNVCCLLLTVVDPVY